MPSGQKRKRDDEMETSPRRSPRLNKKVTAVAPPTDNFNLDAPIKKVRLKSGVLMPILTFGTYKLKEDDATTAVIKALKMGYNALDTAWVYANEKEVGAGIASKKHGRDREDIFVQTKVWRSHHGYERTMKHAKQSMRRLGLEYLDSLIIHWPGPGWHRFKRYDVPKGFTPEMRLETWKAMSELQKEGKVKSIGVSNYAISHLNQLIKNGFTPDVNQVEFHPLCYQKELLAFCKKHNILLQAYAPLGAGDQKVLGHPIVAKIAKELGRTPAQVLIRWVIQHGAGVAVKSGNPGRMKENAGVFDFELPPAAMDEINGISGGEIKRFCWKGVDPATID